ncbi:DUF397 domain-containing protein [Streptomyces sp. NPDC059010]|uniref:DUF397 domain-containing protein n=1 Tax=Streptomyces sp. NPDC059010 TaxID=3346695 RepID=UPI0036AC1BC9
MKRSKGIDLSLVVWRKSSYSDAQGADCVEVADNLPGAVVPVRDSKNPKGPALVFPHQSWALFLDSLKAS